MNDTQLTVQGYVGTPVTLKEVNGQDVATFRLASTPRRYDRNVNGWVDQETNWFTVNAWRALARHCADSLDNGDPVIVHGRLTCQSWTNAEGQKMTTMVLDATSAGHDLSRGTSKFTKSLPGKAGESTVDESLAQLNALLGETGGQVTSDGAVVQDPAA